MEFILVVGAVVALFWTGVVLLRGGLVGGSLLVLLAASCFGQPFFSLPLSPIPLTSDRVLLAIVVAQYFIYRHWGWIDPKPLTKADYLLGAFLALLLVSALTHDFRANKMLPLSQFVFLYAMPAALYWVARQAQWTQRSALWMFAALGVFGVYLSLTAIAETHQWWAVVFPRYIGSTSYVEFLGRGRGPFLNPVGTGFFMSVCLLAALMWWPRVQRSGQLLMLLVLLPLFALGSYFTLTRSVWMGMAAGLTVLIGLSLPGRWRVSVLGTLTVLGVFAVAGSWEYLHAFKRDKDLSVEDMSQSAKLRPIFATVAWHMFLDRPLLGCGFGQYNDEHLAYLSDRSTDLPLEKARPFTQHNVFLGLLTETGLVGAGLFIAMLAYLARDAWRVWRCLEAPLWARQCALLFLAGLAVYIPNGLFHNVTLIPVFNMLLFFLAGVAAAVTPLAHVERTVERLRVWTPVPARG